MNKQTLTQSGIVGCGGAGFPTHVKLAAQNVEYVLVNAAECEPLLHKDKEILWHFSKEFFAGLVEAMRITNAPKAVIGIKRKYSKLIDFVKSNIPDSSIEVLPLGDFYPAGDEYELVYEATGRLIPFGGIPLNIGCVVMNVETLLNIGRNKQVTTKFLSIAGDVPNPCTVEVPFGISISEAIAISGRKSLEGCTVIDGGPMMGKLIQNPCEDIVSKTCGGLIVLPDSHVLINKMRRNDKDNTRIARSACDQCTDCSELCPRALLGYPIRPHKAMRSSQLAPGQHKRYSIDSIFCCECGLCSLFACPEDLPPREICIISKKANSEIKPADFKGEPIVHPMRSMRRVSIERLVKKLGLISYDNYAPFVKTNQRYEKVTLLLKMHLGAPAEAIVKLEQQVKEGEIVARIPEKTLSATIHSPLSGYVKHVDKHKIVIVKK